MRMKTVIFFGAGRANGVTRRMVQAFRAQAPGTVVLLDAYRDYRTISPCHDCRYCWSHPTCSMHDRMEKVYDALTDADVVLIASPVYFFGVSGVLKTMLDRLQVYWAARHLRRVEPFPQPKKGAVLLCGGAPSHEGQFDSALATCFGVLRELNAPLVGSVTLSATDRLTEDRWKECEAQIQKLAHTLYGE